jgi:predicted RNA binding protein YcfA (HicA-like mRNA interferase family)
MSRLPRVTARTMLTALKKAGFEIVRSKGSHHYLVHETDSTRRTVIAVHPGDIDTRDVMDILKQTRISRNEFLDLR